MALTHKSNVVEMPLWYQWLGTRVVTTRIRARTLICSSWNVRRCASPIAKTGTGCAASLWHGGLMFPSHPFLMRRGGCGFTSAAVVTARQVALRALPLTELGGSHD